MTLLESVIAFVLLAVMGIACLELSRGASSLETRSVEWSHATAVGEAALTAAAAGVPLDDPAFRHVTLRRTPWRGGSAGLDVIDVTVELPNGAAHHAVRLARRAPALTR